MADIMNKMTDHHKYGIKALKKVHETDRLILFTSILQSVLTALFPYIELYLSAFIIDALLVRNYGGVPALIVLLVLFNLIVGLVIDYLNHLNTFRADNVHRQMIKEINKKAMELDYEEMEDAGLLQRISDAAFIMEHIGGYNVFILYYRRLVENLIKMFTSFIMIIHLILLPGNSQGGVIALVASVPFSLGVFLFIIAGNLLASRLISGLMKARTAKGYHKKMKVERELNYYSDEVYMNDSMGKDIRLFDMSELILGRHGKALKESIAFYSQYYHDADRDKETYYTIIHSFCTLAAYAVIMFKILARAITIGELSKYIGAVHIWNQAVTDFIDVNQKISMQAEFIRIFDAFMNIRNVKSTGTRRVDLDADKSYCIAFHDVSFRYKNSDAYTLKNVSCKITSNSQIAMVGRNGAGKTTFIKLICRLYEPTEGYISLNGVDIREYSFEEYSTLFSVVFQDFSLFSFPVSENVAVSITPDNKKVWSCLQLAGVSQAVNCMPDKLETNLYKHDENGVNISGGEAQKIAIARALYKNAPIVILDEPTAALDPISEYEIFSSFRSVVKGKTSITISHRMGSCRFSEEILVFDGGTIVQRGRHEDLIQQRNGLYAELYLAQADYYDTAG